MADTTKADVLNMAPELSGASDEQFTLALADAALLITDSNITDSDQEEVLQRYYVAHLVLCYLDAGTGGGATTGEKVGDWSKSYSSGENGSEYDRTKYGTIFKKLWHRYRKVGGA